MDLRRVAQLTWADIARRLGYAGKSGAHAAVLRLYEDDERTAGNRRWRQGAHQRLDDLTRLKRGWPTLDEARAAAFQ